MGGVGQTNECGQRLQKILGHTDECVLLYRCGDLQVMGMNGRRKWPPDYCRKSILDREGAEGFNPTRGDLDNSSIITLSKIGGDQRTQAG